MMVNVITIGAMVVLLKINLTFSNESLNIRERRKAINSFLSDDKTKKTGFCNKDGCERDTSAEPDTSSETHPETQNDVLQENNIEGIESVQVHNLGSGNDEIKTISEHLSLFQTQSEPTSGINNSSKEHGNHSLNEESQDPPQNVENDSKHEEEKNPYKRIKLPRHDTLKVNKSLQVSLPGDMESNVTVISVNPLIISVDNLIDEEECDLLISLAKAKGPKEVRQKIFDVKMTSLSQIFSDWDYNEDGFITHEEVTMLNGLSNVNFDVEDVEDMFFLLKMDENNDNKISFDEMKNTDFSKLKEYIKYFKTDEARQRNTTSLGAWVWHDEDELLKFEQDYGYFDQFHDRLSFITDIPSEIIKESEPLQVRRYGVNQYQVIQQDSEPVEKQIPCCMYGDKNKCRNCRYISYAIFLNDVEEGGELVFPLANSQFQHLMNNSGTWRGFYTYTKATGHKYYFQVDLQFHYEGKNRVFTGEGKEESSSFYFVNGHIVDNRVSFEKTYGKSEKEMINYSGKEMSGTKIIGNWWVPGNQRFRGTFFMWNRNYEVFSKGIIDSANRREKCPQSNLVIKPKKGKAVFWYNHRLDPLDGMVGAVDKEAMTAQCEVRAGEKWMVMSWINIIGDGDLELRAWRKGYNLLRQKAKDIYEALGTNDEKLQREPYEEEFFADIEKNTDGASGADMPGYYKHKPSSNALQGLTFILDELNSREKKFLLSNVEHKLGLQCVPLVGKYKDKVFVVDGSKE